MDGYGSDSGFNTWLSANGYVVPATAPSEAVLRERGSVYLDAVYDARPFGLRFLGARTGGYSQARAWPRTGVTAHGSAVPDNVIPTAVIEASYYAAYHEALNPGSLLVSATDGGIVRRKKVDVLEVEYFEGGASSIDAATLRLISAEGLIRPYLYGEFERPVGIRAIGL